MSRKTIKKLKKLIDIKYPNLDYSDRSRIIIATLKPMGTVTTAPKNKQQQAYVTREKFNILK